MRSLKFVIVGDAGVGKTSIQRTFESGIFRGECRYVSAVYCATSNNIVVDGKRYSFSIWDTAGGEEYDRLRQLSYPQTDLIIICFSLVNLVSFDNIKLKWLPEICRHCPDTPIILLGNKLDLRNQQLPTIIPEEHTFAKEIGAEKYLECSAKTQDGLHDVFKEAVRTIIFFKPKRKLHCQIL